jgi:flagellar hook assembly protein FlgD
VAAGDPRFGFAGTDARDTQNHTVSLATGVTAVTPKTFVTAFAPAMPNPFAHNTTFAFSLAKAGRADLEVYSVDGRRVRTITSGLRDAGEYRLQWNGADDAGRRVAPGVYYARLVTAQGHFTRVVTCLE